MNKDLSEASGALGAPVQYAATHPIDVEVAPALTHRNRLTVAFRPLLALPHIVLVGGPVAFATSLWWRTDHQSRFDAGAGAGVLGAVACVVTIIACSRSFSVGDIQRGFGTSPHITSDGVFAPSRISRSFGTSIRRSGTSPIPRGWCSAHPHVRAIG
jgi:hypothetical protein